MRFARSRTNSWRMPGWGGDGDHELLYQDVTNRPLDGGRLMFAENFGTRRESKSLILILKINDTPQVLDWNDDGSMDLIAGREFFDNVNKQSRGSLRDQMLDRGATRRNLRGDRGSRLATSTVSRTW